MVNSVLPWDMARPCTAARISPLSCMFYQLTSDNLEVTVYVISLRRLHFRETHVFLRVSLLILFGKCLVLLLHQKVQ